MMQLGSTEVFILFAFILPFISSQRSTEDNGPARIENPVLGVDANVTCGGRAIEVSVSQSYLQRNKQWFGRSQWLTLSEPACKATFLSNGNAFVQVNGDFTGCGNKISVMETVSARGRVETTMYKFSNRLIIDSGNDVMSRQIELLKFDCIYPATQLVTTVDSQVDIHVIQLDQLSGKMVIHKSKNLVSLEDLPQNSESGGLISVEITVNEPQLTGISNVSFDFVTVVETCWVAIESDGSSSNVSLISDGCPVRGRVELLSNSESLTGRFSMRMFSFLTTGKEPVLHCLVKICNRTSPDGCVPTCGPTRKRRALYEIEESEKVTIFVKSFLQEMVSKLPSVNQTLTYTTVDRIEEITEQSMESTTLQSLSKAERSTRTNMSASPSNYNETSVSLIALVVGIGLVLVVIGVISLIVYKFKKAGLCKVEHQEHTHTEENMIYH